MNKIKQVFAIGIIPVAVMIIGYLLLVFTRASIPQTAIVKNIVSSAEMMDINNQFPTIGINGLFIDDWTNADCLSIVYNQTTSNPFRNALEAYHMTDDSDPIAAGVGALKITLEGKGSIVGDHSYLWHGYQVLLRPLLLISDMSEIRRLMVWIIILVSTDFCVNYSMLTSKRYSYIPFLLSISFFLFQYEALSFLLFNDVAIALIAADVILVAEKKRKSIKPILFFTYIGALVAFSSMLIVPLITLGIPLIVWLDRVYLVQKSKEGTKCVLSCSAGWMWGYGLTMAVKLAISHFIGSGEGDVRVQTYSSEGAGRLRSILDVWVYMFRTSPFRMAIASIILMVIVYWVFKNKKITTVNFAKYTPFLILGFFPVVWCFCMAGHTGHGWTDWNYCITIFAVLTVLFDIREHTDS